MARQVFLLQLAVVTVLVGLAVFLLVLQARQQATRSAYDRSLSVAEAFANAPGTREAMRSRDPSAQLQPAAEATRKAADVTYVVAFDPDGIRWSHPDPDLIGGHVSGSFAPALTGEPFQETFESTLFGRAVDTTVAVFDQRGAPVGFVSVGITLTSVEATVTRHLPLLFGAACVALLLAAGGTTLVSRRLRRQTHGLGPRDMTRMYEHHDAVLHSVREGVVILDSDGRLTLANDEARRLLNLPANAEGPVGDLRLDPGIASLLASGRTANDEVRVAGGRLLSVNQRPVGDDGRQRGTVATLRDTTELRALAARGEAVRGQLHLLYDTTVRQSASLDVAESARATADAVVPSFADFATIDLFAEVLEGDVPADGDSPMRRTAVTGVRADHPFVPEGDPVRNRLVASGAGTPDPRRPLLVTDLARDSAWYAGDPAEARRVLDYGVRSLIEVPLVARGVALGVASFWRMHQDPFGAEDVTFAAELGTRTAMSVDNARRFTREHRLAVSLQRSLMPADPLGQGALEVAFAYVPAVTGAGGSWSDVLPLSGGRYALVIGDVQGRGLYTAATMGRLRTAVHNFSALDLPPADLITRLDEVVARIDAQEEAGGRGEAISGATCLYAVYDRVSGVCTLAHAGHPAPAIVTAEGSVDFVALPESPFLGKGGTLPRETTEVTLADGSLLFLFSGGLPTSGGEAARGGPDGLADALARAVAGPGDRGPDAVCRSVVEALDRPDPADDVTLLVARARRVEPGRLREWDVASDPAVVAGIRSDVLRQMEAWNLSDLADATELIVSELVTNAIRYGRTPIRLRLLYDVNSLICEITDGSSTSPHLRRAAPGDEGGRGLFLVARFAQHWGTRYLDRGKTIWTEQSLTPASAAGPEADDLLDAWPDLEDGAP